MVCANDFPLFKLFYVPTEVRSINGCELLVFFKLQFLNVSFLRTVLPSSCIGVWQMPHLGRHSRLMTRLLDNPEKTHAATIERVKNNAEFGSLLR